MDPKGIKRLCQSIIPIPCLGALEVLTFETACCILLLTVVVYYCSGGGASPEGNRPFLDLLDVKTKQTKRLWQSTPPYLEYPMNLLNDLDNRPIR